jgi:hypothetical protein
MADSIQPLVVSMDKKGHARVYHRGFPEAQCEGDSTEVAIARLRDCLVRGLDHLDPWQRDPVIQAIFELESVDNADLAALSETTEGFQPPAPAFWIRTPEQR